MIFSRVLTPSNNNGLHCRTQSLFGHAPIDGNHVKLFLEFRASRLT